jgi:ribosome-binding factor A
MRRSSGTARDYPRTARLNHLIHEIVAEELERIDDERLGFLTVVAVEVERDLRRAVVWYTTLDGPVGGPDDGHDAERHDADGRLADALERHRARIQSAIARQAHIRRTPELSFQPDLVIRQAERVEEILRDIGDSEVAERGEIDVDERGGGDGG